MRLIKLKPHSWCWLFFSLLFVLCALSCASFNIVAKILILLLLTLVLFPWHFYQRKHFLNGSSLASLDQGAIFCDGYISRFFILLNVKVGGKKNAVFLCSWHYSEEEWWQLRRTLRRSFLETSYAN